MVADLISSADRQVDPAYLYLYCSGRYHHCL